MGAAQGHLRLGRGKGWQWHEPSWTLSLQRMLRIYFMQNRFNLSEQGAEDALYDSRRRRARWAIFQPGFPSALGPSSMGV
jgi:hypothetical protein